MAEIPRTPSPKTSTAVPQDAMAVNPPQTPDGRKASVQATETPSNSGAMATNVLSASDGLAGASHTASGQLRACTTDKEAYKMVLVHTAKCSECDKRNMDTMLRCPGCTFQICKPCHERREKNGRELTHGSMTSPSGGIFRSGGLGSGRVTRKKLASVAGSLSPSPGPSRARKAVEKDVDGDVAMSEENGGGAAQEVVNKGKGKSKVAATPASKPVSKKRGGRGKSRAAAEDDSDDEYGTESGNKRRRSTVHITDSPTSTSVRPSRQTSHVSYVVQSSPESTTKSDSSPTNRVSSNGTQAYTESSPAYRVSSNGTQTHIKTTPVSAMSSNGTQATKANSAAKAKPVAQGFGARIQQLLEEHGVNTPQNRYQQHFLERVLPVQWNPVISMPPARDLGVVRREQNGNGVDANGNAANQSNTVRSLAQSEASAYIAANVFSADENDELMSAVLAGARRWANGVWEQMLSSEQKAHVVRGLDMQLDLFESWFASSLKETVAECATVKVAEFMAEREGMQG